MSGTQTALLVVDVQAGMYEDPGFQPHNGSEVIDAINQLIATARSVKAPVVFVQHKGREGNPLANGKPGHAIDPRLHREAGDPVIVKSHCAAFHDTELEATLNGLNVSDLIICGIQTDHCVDSAVRIAVDRGFDVTIAKGAHTTFDTDYLTAAQIIEHHEAVWADSFGRVRDIEVISFGGGA